VNSGQQKFEEKWQITQVMIIKLCSFTKVFNIKTELNVNCLYLSLIYMLMVTQLLNLVCCLLHST